MEIRINKFLSEAGVCSRRAADALIESGRVTIDGKRAVMGSKVASGQSVCVDGKPIMPKDNKVVIAFNKPVGVVCTAARDEKNNVIDYIGYDKRIFPIGRLDKDSEGLLLLTNDGELMNAILKAANGHEKEYIVTVNKEISDEFIKGMSGGVPILDRITNPCPVTRLNDRTFNIVLTQGLNRQIRRMCEYFGYRVTKLRRVRIMNIKLGALGIGAYRELTGSELNRLYEMTDCKK